MKGALNIILVKVCVIMALMSVPMSGGAGENITSTFNPARAVLPSSQWTPEAPYTAMVWVFNEGRRYSSEYYNHIWATPENDANGRQWFDADYTPAEGVNAWHRATAPFSSDAVYKGQKSYRWVESEIMGEMYMRRTFRLDNYIAEDIYLACGHDDAPAEWYINGTLVHSVADGWNNDEYVLLTDEQKTLIKMDGSDNVLAVHVHQNWGGAFADCGLYVADMQKNYIVLPTVDEVDSWPCNYYILNYNSDINQAESCNWASLDEDVSDWIDGVGPFSNDANKFYVTEWPSQLRPMLVRRDFALSAEELEMATDGAVVLQCSYDENPKVYLNGKLIWEATGWNDNNYAEYRLTETDKDLLREGGNVLAVSLTQGDGGGHLDMGLSIVSAYTPSGVNAVKVDYSRKDGNLYNIYGQLVGNKSAMPKLNPGIYIVDGMKIVVK